MDECDGRIVALPCCLSWIQNDYGTIGSAPLEELWNSEGAQRIRELLATGRQHEVCSAHCPHWMSGRYGESSLRIVDGSAEFVANQELNLAEIRERRTVLRSRPMLLKVIPTLRCNLRCSMCFQDYFGSVNLGENFWKEIEQLLSHVHEITFQGGEVTLAPDFRRFLDSAALRMHPRVRLSLITNGTVLDPELLELLGRVRMNCVVVSVNAATRETYRAVAKKDLFSKVVENLCAWIKLGQEHRLGTFPVYASFVVMRTNFRELPRFMELADEWGAAVQLLQVIGDHGGEDIFVRQDQHEALSEVLDKAAGVARGGAAKDQVARIRSIMDSHRQHDVSAVTGRGGAQ